MSNIDKTDRRILVELQADARRPNKALAQAAGVSPSTMLHRVRALESQQVIKGYHAEVDLAALGRPLEALVSIKLQPKSPEAVQELVERMWALDETTEVTLVTGSFDVLVHLCVPNVAALSHVVLTSIASAPNVVDEQTAIVFEHRRKRVLGPLEDD